ncbi:hypothetical protein KCP75_24435 [Salmonella enterica subsp. enterica]|nr:hypothetical protein KCP75_24435 [Salmonella enterica subsp. enterica]
MLPPEKLTRSSVYYRAITALSRFITRCIDNYLRYVVGLISTAPSGIRGDVAGWPLRLIRPTSKSGVFQRVRSQANDAVQPSADFRLFDPRVMVNAALARFQRAGSFRRSNSSNNAHARSRRFHARPA